MKINLKELKNALTLAKQVSPSRSPKEILQCSLVRCAGNKAAVFSTDGEIFSVASASVDGATGDFCVNTDKLWEICSRATSDPDFQLSGNILIVKPGRGEMEIPTVDPITFPERLRSERPLLEIDGPFLRECIDRTIHAAGSDLRLALNGLNFRSVNGKLMIAGFNGNRSSVVETELDCGEFNETVPLKMVKAVKSIVSSDVVRIGTTGSSISFANGNASVSGQLLQGAFPGIKSIIDEAKDFVEINQEELLQVVRQAEVVQDEESRNVELTFSGNEMLVSAKSNKGKFSSSIKIDGNLNCKITVGSEHLIPAICGNQMCVMEGKGIFFRETTDKAVFTSVLSARG